MATPAQAVVARDDVGATAIRDTTNVWPYVGQMIDLGGPTFSGGVGLCTGSVIAPRVVMFAAHCVGGNISGYEDTVGLGANNMAFTFNSRNLDALRRHVGLDPSPQPIYQTNVADRYYRVVDVITHPRNADNGFEAGTADIALAVLDTPIDWFEGVPLLFSQPTATENIEIVGYGNQGTMSTGQISIDWWRRQGGNNLGFVGSDNDVFASDLFGNTPPFAGWDGANLWTDCDSHLVPRPGGDFNILGGSALANEVCVAQGDSGGAMWVTRGGQKVAVGVASYGYSFGPSFGHGSLVAHTALFPYWDFIVANNGYVYSNAKAGGGAWENPATWSQSLNPNYFTTGAGGALVNSLPTTDPASTTGPFTRVGGVRPLPLFPVPNGLYVDLDGNDLGIDQAAFLQMGIDAAQQNNVAHGGTGNIVPGYSGPGNEGGEGGEGSQNPGNGGSFESPRGQDFIVATSASGGGSGLGGSGPVPAVGGVGSGFWPVGTTPLSGPNSTNFVPDNTNGVIGGAAARFYQVDHGNAGVLTLSSTRSVDRFRLLGASSTLQINGGAQLNSMMTSSQSAGTLINNGTFRARGLTVTGGRVQGNGTFNMSSLITQFASTGFALNGGTLAPGNSIGITNIVGNYVQGAGGTLEIEVTNGSSDQVIITGTATLAGTVSFAPFGANPLKGQSFTFLNAAGGRSGTFGTIIDNLPGLLFPVVSYTANTAVVTINASTFCSVAPSQPICSQLDSMDGTTTPAMQTLIQGLQNIDITQISTALASVNPTMINAQGHAALELGDLIKGQLGFRNIELLSAGTGGQQSAMLRAATQLASADASAELIMSAASAAVA
ncbi:MAG TPA: hypothetical protein DCL48_10495, partial [Alphaproteobacteria bacterium]|nr:hypothetical protein [Alphaproteobacteria bacterium]